MLFTRKKNILLFVKSLRAFRQDFLLLSLFLEYNQLEELCPLLLGWFCGSLMSQIKENRRCRTS